MENETDKATAAAEAGTPAADAPAADAPAADAPAAVEEGRAEVEEAGAEADQLTPEQRQEQLQEQIRTLSAKVEETEARARQAAINASAETERRVGQAVQKKDREVELERQKVETERQRSKVRGLVQKARDGETEGLTELEDVVLGAIDRPYADSSQAVATASVEAAITAFEPRVERLNPSQAEIAEYTQLLHLGAVLGNFSALDQKLMEAEGKKAKAPEGTPGVAALEAEKKRLEGLLEKGKVAAARKGKGADLGPSGAGSGATRSDEELQKDPTTPIDKLMEIHARQRAGG